MTGPLYGYVDGHTPQTFPKALRLRKRPEFLRVQNRRKRVTARYVHFLYAPAVADQPGKVGFTVSRKVGKAPVRNRVKRCLRELYRTHQHLWPSDLDVVVVAQPSAKDATFADLHRDLQHWLERNGGQP
jgi:ribonuclease P protein component